VTPPKGRRSCWLMCEGAHRSSSCPTDAGAAHARCGSGPAAPCWPQSLLRACTRISHAGLVLTPMPIVDDPTIPRVGECERKAAFVPPCQAPGRVTRSLRMDPSEARANTSPPGPKTPEQPVRRAWPFRDQPVRSVEDQRGCSGVRSAARHVRVARGMRPEAGR
jgi:hypothetical protein